MAQKCSNVKRPHSTKIINAHTHNAAVHLHNAVANDESGLLKMIPSTNTAIYSTGTITLKLCTNAIAHTGTHF